jgi:transcription termination factor Rho
VTDTSEQMLITMADAPDGASRQATNQASNGPASVAHPADDSAARPARRRGGSLSSMLLPELQELASSMGIPTAKLRKSDLVAAIEQARSGAGTPAPVARPASAARPAAEQPAIAEPPVASDATVASTVAAPRRERRAAGRAAGSPAPPADTPAAPSQAPDAQHADAATRDQARTQDEQRPDVQGQQNQGGGPGRDDDFEGGRRRGRRYRDRRGRNRDRTSAGPVADTEPTVAEDDVLLPVAGILDSVEEKNTWFIRTSGYYAGPDDIYVANSFVRRFGLRRGDAVTGVIRQPREGERREKFSPLVRLDTVNGRDPDEAKNRVEFTKLTPLYPQERLRLETDPHQFTTRVIDLVMPIGKGQRALIVSPPKAGKTMILQAIAKAISVNNPECHLMVVLVDERPEEVTDMQRSVKGEVIASTFDRRPQDHTMVAELSIERAKRLVELGHDVVVLLDSITRLGRAYNLAAPASGRILSGGIDSTALHLPKRFLGAARNIENGGSLTIIATALVETGSQGDQVIFEEYKGTGNAELRLRRDIADKRVFPAVDVDLSSTRKEELLLSPDELAVTVKLRRVLHALEPQQAIDLLLDRLRKTRTNIEFLMQIAKTTPGAE